MKPHAPNCCQSKQVGETTLTIHLNPSIRGNSERYKPETLSRALFSAFEKVAPAVKLSDIDVTVYESIFVIPEYGFGAQANDSDTITVRISPTFDDIMTSIQTHLPSLFAHELNHCARQLAIPYWSDLNLKASIISEGLAQNFQREIYPDSNIYVNEEVMNDYDTWLAKARDLFNATEYNYDAWFFGDNSTPRWVGYTLGYHLVKEYLHKNKLTAAQAVDIKTKDFDI